MFGTYTKFITTLLATLGVALVPILSDDVVTNTEWINIIIVGFGAATVLGATNLPTGVWRFTKGWFAAGSAAAVGAAGLVSNGFTTPELIQLGLAAAGAVGVFGLHNAGSGPDGESTAATGAVGLAP